MTAENFDLSWIKKIAEQAAAEGVTELEYQSKEGRISFKMKLSSNSQANFSQVNTSPFVETPKADNDPYADKERYMRVVAPLGGKVYYRPKPADPPFVNMGDFVEVGQQLLSVEAMKTFNEISASVKGQLVEILVKDEEMVGEGQALAIIDIKTEVPNVHY